MTKCSFCNKENAHNAHRCISCGNLLPKTEKQLEDSKPSESIRSGIELFTDKLNRGFDKLFKATYSSKKGVKATKKKCPFCNGEIVGDANRCIHCSNYLVGTENQPTASLRPDSEPMNKAKIVSERQQEKSKKKRIGFGWFFIPALFLQLLRWVGAPSSIGFWGSDFLPAFLGLITEVAINAVVLWLIYYAYCELKHWFLNKPRKPR